MISSKWALVWVVLVAGGCASGRDELARELTQMKREMAQVRATNLSLQDRLEGLEERQQRSAKNEATPEEEDRPTLEVVRLEPEGAAPKVEPVEEETDEARPVIKTGVRGSVEMSEGARPVLPQRR
ncbi:MAG TPA: hypothetical protein VFB62_07510 [Polyangiaceae bacterium]|jgi:uncharacterized iron-regulated membrane protein|nr:hypothetical protein [Polyangiaceae bacterium]